RSRTRWRAPVLGRPSWRRCRRTIAGARDVLVPSGGGRGVVRVVLGGRAETVPVAHQVRVVVEPIQPGPRLAGTGEPAGQGPFGDGGRRLSETEVVRVEGQPQELPEGRLQDKATGHQDHAASLVRQELLDYGPRSSLQSDRVRLAVPGHLG